MNTDWLGFAITALLRERVDERGLRKHIYRRVRGICERWMVNEKLEFHKATELSIEMLKDHDMQLSRDCRYRPCCYSYKGVTFSRRRTKF